MRLKRYMTLYEPANKIAHFNPIQAVNKQAARYQALKYFKLKHDTPDLIVKLLPIPYKLPLIQDIYVTLVHLKKFIRDEYREEYEDGTLSLPFMDITIGANTDGTWDYQTGNNCYTGAAYLYPHWVTIELFRRTDSKYLARYIVNELAELFESL